MTFGLKQRILLTLSAACIAVPLTAEAEYSGDSDTGMQRLDYIENRRRTERENRLSAEQQKLLDDVQAMRRYLRRPVKAEEPSPIAFEGDDLSYDEATGEFIANGHVDVVQMEARRFQGEYAEGNIKTADVSVPGRAHVLQLTEGQTRVTLDGYRIKYNYRTHEGTMESAAGKVGQYYMTGKRFEFYPDKIIVYDGTQTKCSAQKPDYHLSADKAEVYPGERMILYNVKFWLKGTMLYRKKRHEVDLKNPVQNSYPRVGYDSEDGIWLKQNITHEIVPHVTAAAHIYVTSRQGWRSNYDVGWYNRGAGAALIYGHFEDSDNEWVKKQPALSLSYESKVGDTPLNYRIYSEAGRWYGNHVHSNHLNYGVRITHDTIPFHGFMIDLAAGFDVTHESYDHSRVRGMNFSGFFTKEFSDRFAAYAGMTYSKSSKENALFGYGQEDFSKVVQAGLSYRLDERNRFIVAAKYAFDGNRWTDVDYYWFHDLHCSQIILRYRSEQNKWKIKWEFTPW